MAWVRIDDGAWDHPKQVQAGPMAVALWLWGLCYCSRHLTDGAIPSAALVTSGVPRAANEAGRLVAAGLWERAEGGFRVHDYHEYNPSREQVTRKRHAGAERLREHRKRRGNAHGNADVTPLQHEHDRVCNINPVPVPVPQEPTYTDTLRAREAVDSVVAAMPRTAHAPGPGRRGRFAFEWRCGVPADLHAELVRKLGGAEDAADAALRAWYRTVADQWPEDRPIGDDDFGFWRARFREWQGTTRLAPPRTPIVTTAHRRQADDIRRRAWGRCQHDPTCATYADCVEALAASLAGAASVSAADNPEDSAHALAL